MARKPAKPEEKVAPPKDAPVEPEKGVGGEAAGGKGETPASTASAAMPHPPGALSSWAEKYRPKSLDEVVGNSRAVAELRKWAGDWEHGHARKKGAILVGSPGTGKTSAAHALAADMKWGVLELNASDSRNYAAIKRVAFSGAVHDTFSDDGEFISAKTGGRKLIILDEADQLYESSDRAADGRDVGDRGGKRAIVETVSRTRQPVLLIVNDSYALTREGGEALKDLCQLIKFDRIRKDVIRVALRRICESELIQWTPDALEELSGRAGGDLRAAVNDLQSLTAGTRVLRMDTLNALGYRDERGKIFEVVVEILKGTGADHARAAMRKLDELPEFVLLWLDENVPLEYKHPDDLERAFNMLSRADVFLGRVSRRQQYGLWGYASDLMSAGVSLAKRRRYHEFNRYRFPLWLIKRSRLKGGSRVEKELLSRIGGYTHLSNYAARHQMLPLFRQLFDSDHNFAVKFVRELGFEPEHIAFILDVESTSPRVRSLLEAAFGSGADRGVTTAMGEFSGADEGDEKPKKPAARKKPAKEIKLGSGDWDEAKQDAGGDKAPGKDKGKDDDAAEDEKGKENSGAKGGAEGEDGDKNQKRLFDF